MSSHADTPRKQLVEHLRRDADAYLPDEVGEPEVRILHELRREASRLFMVDLHRGSAVAPLVAKHVVRADWEAGEATSATRYKLAAVPQLNDRLRSEAAALRQIETFVAESGHPALTSARVYGLVQDEQLLVLERVPGDELRSLLLRAHRLRATSAPPALVDACSSAGAWLRLYHDRMPQEGTPPLVPDAEAFGRVFDEKMRDVERQQPDPGWAKDLRRATEHALGLVTGEFDSKTAHGDFWPGNVILRPDHRIAVIDTFAAGRAPVEVDIAYYLLHLRALSPQIHSQGLWSRHSVIDACESEFLSGYFAEAGFDQRRLALFQILVLLYKWAASTQAFEESSGLARTRKRATLAWRARFYRGLLDRYQNGLRSGY
jgi:aminoglycoside phosphotransferase (APT) family kinase protein